MLELVKPEVWVVLQTVEPWQWYPGADPGGSAKPPPPPFPRQRMIWPSPWAVYVVGCRFRNESLNSPNRRPINITMKRLKRLLFLSAIRDLPDPGALALRYQDEMR